MGYEDWEGVSCFNFVISGNSKCLLEGHCNEVMKFKFLMLYCHHEYLFYPGLLTLPEVG